MTTPTPDKLREEWLKHCNDDSETLEGKLNGYSFVIFDDDANKIADWWLDKRTSELDGLKERVREMKKTRPLVENGTPSNPPDLKEYDETIGFNAALDSVLQELDRMK